MSPMDDLVQFLKDRLAEDEAVARATTQATWAKAEWHFHGTDDAPYVDLGTNHLDRVSSLNEAEMEHIARHDPARVLAQVAAVRGVLAEYNEAAHHSANGERALARGTAGMTLATLKPVLAHLATAYADHGDYRKDWAPRSSWS